MDPEVSELPREVFCPFCGDKAGWLAVYGKTFDYHCHHCGKWFTLTEKKV